MTETDSQNLKSPPPKRFPIGLSFVNGKGVVTVAGHRHVTPAYLDLLEMEIPDLRFPFDLSGGASSFRHRRCKLLRAQVSFDEQPTQQCIAERVAQAAYGFRDLRLSFQEGTVEISGQAVLGDAQTDFIISGFVRVAQHTLLQLCLCDLHLYGPFPVAPPLLAAGLLQAAGSLTPALFAERRTGCCDLSIDPLTDLLQNILPSHGWRIPNTRGSCLSSVVLKPGKLLLNYEAPGGATGPTPPLSERLKQHLETQRAKEQFAAAEDAVLGPHLPDGIRIYQELHHQHPDHLFIIERLLQLWSTNEKFDNQAHRLLDLSRQLDTSFIPAHLAEAAICMRAKQFERAAECYFIVAEILHNRKNTTERIMALLAAGRCFLLTDHSRARECYEKVLELDNTHEVAMAHLAPLYAEASNWEQLVDIRTRQLPLAGDSETRVHGHLALGELFRVHLGQMDRALANFNGALELDPHCEPALKGLAEVYLDNDSILDAIRTLDRLCKVVAIRQDTAGVGTLHLRIASLWEHLGDREASLGRIKQALDLWPENTLALEYGSKLLLEMGHLQQAAELIERLLQTISQPSVRAELLIKLAELDMRLSRPQAAKHNLEQILAADPGHIKALRLLVQLAKNSGDSIAYANILSRAAASESDVTQRSALLLERGKLLAEKQELTEQAVDAFQRAAHLAPEKNWAPLEALARLYQRNQQWHLARQTWESALRTAEGCIAADGHFALAQVYQHQGDHHQCRKTLLRSLALVGEDRSLRREILQLLVATNRLLHDALPLEKAIEELITLVDPATSGELPSLLVELGDVKLKAGDLDGSMTLYARAAELRPEDVDLQETIGRLRVQRCNWELARENLEQVYQSLSHDVTLMPRRAALSMELAAIAEQQGRISDAITLYYRAIEEGIEEEEEKRTWDHLIDLHLARNDPKGAVQASRAASIATPNLERQANLLFLAGQLLLKRLGQPDQAYRCLWEALDKWPKHPGVLDALESMLSQTGDTAELVQVLQKKVEISAKTPEVQKQVLLRLGAVQAQLLQYEQARTAYTGALALDEGCFAALIYLAREAMANEKFDLAEPYLLKIIQLLAQQTIVSHPEQQSADYLETHLHLAHIARHRGLAQQEEGYLEQVLSVAPLNEVALARLDHLLSVQNRHGELTEILERRIEIHLDLEERITLEMRLGRVLEQLPSRQNEAQVLYKNVLSRKPDHLPALVRLADILRGGRPSEEQLDILQRLAEAMEHDGDTVAAGEIWGEAAHLAEAKLGDTGGAIRNLRHALHLLPDHQAHFDKLIELLDEKEHSQEVLNLLSHRASLETDPVRRGELELQLTTRLLDSGGAPEALSLLNNAVNDGRAFPAIISRLAQVHELLNNWEEATNQYFQIVQQAAAAGETAQEIKAATKLIYIYQEVLEDPEQAEKICHRLLEIDPPNPRAQELLADIFQAREQWPQLIELLLQRLEHLRADPAHSIAEEFRITSRVALALDRGGRRLEAETQLQEALDLTRRDRNFLWPLAGLARDMEMNQIELFCLGQLADASPEDPDVHLRLAHLQLDADNQPAALEALHIAVQLLSPGSARTAAVREILRLAESLRSSSAKNWQPAYQEIEIASLQTLSQEEITPGERLHLATLLADDEQHYTQALTLLQEIPDEQSTEQARLLRHTLLERLGRFRELAEEREHYALQQVNSVDRIEALFEVAEFWGKKGRDLNRAQQAALAALQVRPSDKKLIARLAILMGALDGWDFFFDTLRALAAPQSQCGPALQAELFCCSASYRESIGRSSREIEEDLNQALQRDPQCIEALDALIKLYDKQVAPEKLVEVLLQRSDCGADIPERVKALLQAAEILSQRLHRPQDALPLLKRARELRPEDPHVLEAVADLYQLLGDLYQAEEALLTLSHLIEDPDQVLNRACGLARLRGDAPKEAHYLAHLARVKPVDSRILLRLTSSFKAAGDMQGLCSVLEQLSSDSPQALNELAKLYAEQLEDLPSAYDCYMRLLREAPENRENLQAMIEICGRLRKEQEAVTYLQRLCQLEPAGLRCKELNIELARRSEEQGDLVRAEEAWRAALEEAPQDTVLIVRLAENLQQQGHWQRLSVFLENKLDCSGLPPGIHGNLATTLGEVYLDHLDDTTSGIYWLSIASTISDDSDRAFRRLISIYRQQQDFARAAQQLITRLSQMKEGSRSLLWQELGYLQEVHLKDSRAAAKAYSAAYFEDPRGELKFAWRAHELFLLGGDLDQSLTLLEHAISKSEDQDRPNLQVAHAQAMTRRGLNSEAIDEYEQVLRRFPNHYIAHAELGKQLYGQGMFGAALPHLQVGAEHLQEPKEAADQAFLAGCALEKLGLSDEAVKTYEQAVAQNPKAVHILNALIPCYENRGSWDKLAAILTTLIALTTANDERATLMAKLGATQLKCGLKDAAYHSYLKSLAVGPHQLDILAPLRLLAYERQDWKQCADLINREIRITQDPLLRAALHRQLGVLHRDNLGNIEQAIEQLKQALKLDPADSEAAVFLLPLLEQTSHWEDAAHLYRKVADATIVQSDRQKLLLKAVSNLERAGLSTEAQLLSQEIEPDDDILPPIPHPSDSGTSIHLRHGVPVVDNPDRVQDLTDDTLFDQILDPDVDWIALAQSYRKRAAEASDPEICARILLTAAATIDEKLHQPVEALVLYGEAAAAAPDYLPAILALADAAYRNQDWHRARELYDRILGDESYQDRVDICYHRALVYETIGDDLTAADGYTKVLAIDPSHTSALEGRARLALFHNDVKVAIEALTALAALIPADELETLADLREQLGNLHLRENNLQQARKYFEGTLTLESQRISAIQTLITIYERLEEYRAMVQLLDQLVCLTADPLIRASLLFHTAEILGAKIGDESSAIDNLLKAYDLAPDYPPTLWRLIDYYWEKDDLDSVMEMTGHLLDTLNVEGEVPDTRNVRMALALLLVKGDSSTATQLIQLILPVEALLDPAVRDLARAARKTNALEKIARLIKVSDPSGSICRVAEKLYQDRPSTPGLTDLLVRLNELELTE